MTCIPPYSPWYARGHPNKGLTVDPEPAKQPQNEASGRTQVMGRVVGTIGAGSAEEPIRYASTAAAADLPSAIAHTISDWPRPMSPATNTPGTEVANEPSLATLPRASMITPRSSSSPAGPPR